MAKHELKIETAEMNKALDALSAVVSKRNSLPILSYACIRFDHEQKFFTMTGSNGEQFYTLACWRKDEQATDGKRAWMVMEKEDSKQPFGAFCINVDDFRSVFAKLPSAPVSCFLTLDDKSGSIRVVYGMGEFELPVLLATEYPNVPAVVVKSDNAPIGVKPLVKFSMPTTRILPTIIAARVCASTSELYPYMASVCVDCFHDHCVVVATDGHSLFKCVLDLGTGWLQYGEFPVVDKDHQGSAKLLFPTQCMSVLKKAFSQSDEIIVTADTQRINITSGDGQHSLTTVNIEGRYPNYESVIPKNNNYTLHLDKAGLLATLCRITVFSESASNLCIMRRKEDYLYLSASDTSFGRSAEEQVVILNPDCTLPNDFTIGFKIATMQQLLNCVAGDNVVMELGGPNRAMLLKEEDEKSGLTLLIMPMVVG